MQHPLTPLDSEQQLQHTAINKCVVSGPALGQQQPADRRALQPAELRDGLISQAVMAALRDIS